MMNVNRKNDSMKKILVWGLLAVLGIACYDDLGNYDYNDINDMVLEMLLPSWTGKIMPI